MKKLFILLAVFAFMIMMSSNVTATTQPNKISQEMIKAADSQMTGNTLIEENVAVTASDQNAITSMAANKVQNITGKTLASTRNNTAAILKCPINSSVLTNLSVAITSS
jgi:hypothetical protein